MNFVIDSSVALKWFVAEPRHEIAKQIILAGDRLMAPEWAYAEVTNALWSKARNGELELYQVTAAIAELPKYLEFLSCDEPLMIAALELAQSLEHSIYDCVFLAMTLNVPNSVLVTDDDRFAEKVAAKGYGDKIRRLNAGPLALAFTDADLTKVRQLYESSKQTIDSVTTLVSRPFGERGLRIHNTGNLKPAFESPTYVALKREIAKLSSHQVQVLLALAWLGRGYDGEDFERLYDQAAHLGAAPDQHVAYIISLLGYLDRGTAAFQQSPAGDTRDM